MKKNKSQYDAVIIGSGIGGLSSAGLLSKINKKRVLVLEKHHEIGGLTQEFKRGPYSWDVGLHYMGNMKKRFFNILGWYFFRFLTNGKIKWNNMPKTFEKFLFPGLTIEVKDSLKAYRHELINKFPHEKKAIKKYLKDVHAIRIWYLFFFLSKFLHTPMAQIFKFLTIINKKKALMTTEEYFKKNIKDKKLRAVLAARWANYGIPPAESAFAIHAVIEHHYYEGGIFPAGGAEKIASCIEETIEESGGKILTGREVSEIIIENGRAVGVKAINLASKDKKESIYYSPVIISDAGAQITFLKLIPQNLNLAIQKELSKYSNGYSGFNVYLGLKDSPETIGIKGENYWIIDGFELDIFEKRNNEIFNGKACFCLLSFPSLKSGKTSAHTADIVTIFPYVFFNKWGEYYWKERPNEYYELKDRIIESLLRLVDKYIPGFSNLVAYKEIATPLTFKHFTNRTCGTFYGLASVPARYNLKGLKVKTPVKGLYLTGSDILCNGIFPALFSGMATVSYLNGPLGALKVILKTLLYNPEKKSKNNADILSLPVISDEQKAEALLVSKKIKNNHIAELTYQFENSLNLIAGQHVKLLVSESEWRAYSIAKTDKNNLMLLIDIRPGGYGSRYAEKIQVNEKSVMRLPITELIYHETNRPLMFIATGTGIVPFLNIMDELKKNNDKKRIVVLFGCMLEADNFTDEYLAPYESFFQLEKYIYVENAKKDSKYIKGRVTDMLKSGKYNLQDFDFYVCGHPNMTQSVLKHLRSNGAQNIYW